MRIWEWVRDIGIAVVVAVVILQFIKPTVVEGHSMEPTLSDKDYLLISKQAYHLFEKPEYGDIIVCHSDETTEDGKEKLLIKRIIGLPNDTITIENGKVYRNGEELRESYILGNETSGTIMDFTIPEEELFVLGDNRPSSLDSRSKRIGCVPEEDVVGRAFIRLYPFEEIGLLE